MCLCPCTPVGRMAGYGLSTLFLPHAAFEQDDAVPLGSKRPSSAAHALSRPSSGVGDATGGLAGLTPGIDALPSVRGLSACATRPRAPLVQVNSVQKTFKSTCNQLYRLHVTAAMAAQLNLYIATIMRVE